MTISAAISSWLSQIESMEIDTNHITDGSDKYGLFKTPSRNTRELIDGSYEVTEFYQFFARQSSVSEGDRKDSDEWLEELAYMADDAGTVYALPEIDKNRRITRIQLTGTPYPMEASSDDTLYQMSLSITYTREREV